MNRLLGSNGGLYLSLLVHYHYNLRQMQVWLMVGHDLRYSVETKSYLSREKVLL